MGIFANLDINPKEYPSIDWDLLPAETFAIFESWGGKTRVRSSRERHYYFFIDNWQSPASLYLMERGIRHSKLMAKIKAPQSLINRAISTQGTTKALDRTYAIDHTLKTWLKENVVDSTDQKLVEPIHDEKQTENTKTQLPGRNQPVPELAAVALPAAKGELAEEDAPALIKKYNLYDSRYNPADTFDNYLVDNGDELTVSDKVTSLMWQRGGCDITSIRKMTNNVAQLNKDHFAGYNDWRLPTITEALSLMKAEVNHKGLYLDPCFSREQPFIFVANHRNPGGYWFCDYKQGTVFWASGTIPGGFGRVVRTDK